jgi:hypothetical protein
VRERVGVRRIMDDAQHRHAAEIVPGTDVGKYPSPLRRCSQKAAGDDRIDRAAARLERRSEWWNALSMGSGFG